VHLGEEHYEQADTAIGNYLDFEWHNHWADDEDKGYRLPWIGSEFPAFQALYSMEDKAVPALIEYLAGADRPPLGRKYAFQPFFLLGRHGDPQTGIGILARASRAASRDPVAAGRLWVAANEAAAMCWDEIKHACQAALIERPSQ
jgi:hypothetical protein